MKCPEVYTIEGKQARPSKSLYKNKSISTGLASVDIDQLDSSEMPAQHLQAPVMIVYQQCL